MSGCWAENSGRSDTGNDRRKIEGRRFKISIEEYTARGKVPAILSRSNNGGNVTLTHSTLSIVIRRQADNELIRQYYFPVFCLPTLLYIAYRSGPFSILHAQVTSHTNTKLALIDIGSTDRRPWTMIDNTGVLFLLDCDLSTSLPSKIGTPFYQYHRRS